MRWMRRYFFKSLGKFVLLIVIVTCGLLGITRDGKISLAQEFGMIRDKDIVPTTPEATGWADQSRIKLFNKRFWDLVHTSRGHPDKINATLPLFNSYPVPYLWRPLHTPIHPNESTRIIPQTVWQMEAAANSPFASVLKQPKTILVWEGFSAWYDPKWTESREIVPGDCEIAAGASVLPCRFTDDREELEEASAVLSKGNSLKGTEGTLRVYLTLESPFHSEAVLGAGDQDILASYWRGSDIVTPYGKWLYYDEDVRAIHQDKDYSLGKSKAAAAFISNCNGPNDRLGYIGELQKYIQVDVYGLCGPHQCGRESAQDCFRLLKKDYFFYLAFENSNCRDYITEKFFLNALANDVVPVVMGASPQDYQVLAPSSSYIHVEDYSSPKELSSYLAHLIRSPPEYNRYFEWKGTGELIAHSFFCQLCAMVHYSDLVRPPKRRNAWGWSYDGLKSGLCLPRGKWYWGRDR